jgi:phosphotransferase system enzyme I (PtsP)
MLDTLRRIIQEVNAAADLQQALEIIVQRVTESVGVDVASVYLVDVERGEFVLSATCGLRKDAIGKVRLTYGDGLVGMVAVREEPVNLEDAPTHPRYRFASETGRNWPALSRMPVPAARLPMRWTGPNRRWLH